MTLVMALRRDHGQSGRQLMHIVRRPRHPERLGIAQPVAVDHHGRVEPLRQLPERSEAVGVGASKDLDAAKQLDLIQGLIRVEGSTLERDVAVLAQQQPAGGAQTEGRIAGEPDDARQRFDPMGRSLCR